jgi:hypothetical protein
MFPLWSSRIACENDYALFTRYYESSRIFPGQEKFFLPDLSELAAKKSAIFSLPIHSNQVKRCGLCGKKFGMTHNIG